MLQVMSITHSPQWWRVVLTNVNFKEILRDIHYLRKEVTPSFLPLVTRQKLNHSRQSSLKVSRYALAYVLINRTRQLKGLDLLKAVETGDVDAALIVYFAKLRKDQEWQNYVFKDLESHFRGRRPTKNKMDIMNIINTLEKLHKTRADQSRSDQEKKTNTAKYFTII